MMTQYCGSKTVKVNRSVEQEIIRQRDTAEVKAHMLKNRLTAVQSVNRQVKVLELLQLLHLVMPGSLMCR